MVRYYRKIIHIRAEDSPNVFIAQKQLEAGMPPTNEIIVPGVLSYAEYVKRRTTWDPVLQCVGLDGQFWEGEDTLMYPPHWLNRAEQRHDQLMVQRVKRQAIAIGIDPGEGSAKTAWSVTDHYGLMYQMAFRTPDTAVVVNETIALLKRYNVKPENVAFDAGGGLAHACQMRERGYNVRTIAFGDSPTDNTRRKVRWKDRISNQEQKSAYVNRRAEMYGELMEYLDPSINEMGYAIPSEYKELRRQLALMPKKRDREGKLFMLPKYKRDPRSTEKTLTELLGASPDEADSLVLAIHAMVHEYEPIIIGVG